MKTLLDAKDIVEEWYQKYRYNPTARKTAEVLQAEAKIKVEDPAFLTQFKKPIPTPMASTTVKRAPLPPIKNPVPTPPAEKVNPIQVELTADVKIQVTEDYRLFKTMKGNRIVLENKVKKLIKSIQGGLNLLKYCPILINESYEIIDGQHRFETCKRLKLPVYYIRVPKFEISQVAEMNSNSDKWKVTDFLKCYKENGISDYAYLEEFLNRYPGLPATIAVALLMTGSSSGESALLAEKFKQGKFEVKEKSKAENLMKYLADFAPYFSSTYTRAFMGAIETLLESESYDHKEMITKIERFSDRLEKKALKKQYLAMLEDIYNIQARNRKRIY